MRKICGLIIILSVLSRGFADAQIASGGNFTLEQSVVAAGGGQSSAGGNFTLAGTIGQSLAGNAMSGSSFDATSGFQNGIVTINGPMAASVSGRVVNTNGRGIRNVSLTLTSANGESRTVLSGAFGYYRFAEVSVGETYILTVSAKNYTITDSPHVLTVTEEMNEINFLAVN